MNLLEQILSTAGSVFFGYGLGTFRWTTKAEGRRLGAWFIGIGIAFLITGALRSIY